MRPTVILLLFCFLHLLSLAGCQPKANSKGKLAAQPSNATEPAATGPLRMLVLDDPELAQVLEREWRARSDSPVELRQDSVAQFTAQMSEGMRQLETDVVIFPASLLGDLAERKLIRQLPVSLTEEPAYNLGEVFTQIRRREMLWDRRHYGVSFGSPTLMLLYRKEWVAQPPQTWAELSTTLKQLEDKLPAGILGLAQPLGAGWKSRMLLARAAPYLYSKGRISTFFDYVTLEPRIATPPVVRALEELANNANHGGAATQTPADVLEDFLAGKSAMAITWPSAIASKIETREIPFEIGIVDLPGSSQRYDFRSQAWVPTNGDDPLRVSVTGIDGRLGAVSRAARNASQATTFLGWATGREQSSRVSPRSGNTMPFRSSQLANTTVWVPGGMQAEVAATFGRLAKVSLQRAENMPFPRLPGADRYAALLDQAVEEVLSNGVSAPEALGNAAHAWAEVTATIGIEQQKTSYLRSLGIETR